MKDTSPKLKAILDYGSFETFSPVTFVSIPRPEDYKNGFITRYFVSQRNVNDIIETSLASYTDVSSILYEVGSLKWKITGPKYSEYKDSIRTQIGVWEYNNNQIAKLEKKLPGIKSALPDIFQYWKRYAN